MLRKPSQGEGGLLLTDSIEPKPTISTITMRSLFHFLVLTASGLDLVSDARLFSQGTPPGCFGNCQSADLSGQ